MQIQICTFIIHSLWFIQHKHFRNISSVLKNELLSLCPVNIFQKIDNDILNAILTNGVSPDKIVDIISQSLLRIIPNIILNKREEAVPLLVSAVLLCNDPSMRDKLLQQLFNLKKKPSDSERTLILLGMYVVSHSVLTQILKTNCCIDI